MLHTGMFNPLILAPIRSSPNEQNGINAEGEKFPNSSTICTGWFVTLFKSNFSRKEILLDLTFNKVKPKNGVKNSRLEKL